MYENMNTPNIAGLPTTKANPAFNKNIFKRYVAKFADYIDRDNGTLEEGFVEVSTPLVINGTHKIVFDVTQVANSLSAIGVNDNKDIVLLKNTNLCYPEGYSFDVSNITIQNSSLDGFNITIKHYLGDKLCHSEIAFVNAFGITLVDPYTFDTQTTTYNEVLTTVIETSNEITLSGLKVLASSKFLPATGDGKYLYELFCNIANNKIIKNIWNSEWEYGMSLCIGHYLAITVRESEVSYGLGDIAKDSGPRGAISSDMEKIKYDYKNTLLNRNQSKFWNQSQYGALLISLLETKAIPTIIVVN